MARERILVNKIRVASWRRPAARCRL